MMQISIALRMMLGVATCAFALSGVASAEASVETIAGKIEWGLWVDAAGCEHWWSDGGTEGFMVARVNPANGKPVCRAKRACLTAGADALFPTGSAILSDDGRRKLTDFFLQEGNVTFGIDGHTDSRGGTAANLELSRQRAAAVGDLGRSLGAKVDREEGMGEAHPLVPNTSAANMQKNRRVEVVCYQR